MKLARDLLSLDDSWETIFMRGDWAILSVWVERIKCHSRLQVAANGDHVAILFERGVRISFVTSSFGIQECLESPLKVPIGNMARVQGHFALFRRIMTLADLRKEMTKAIADLFPEEGFAELVCSFDHQVQ
jgi:hypothetical protein